MTSDQQYLPIEVTIATNYAISFLYNKLPRRRVDVFAEELSAAIHKKLASEAQSNQQRTVRIAVSPPLELDNVVTDAIRSSGLTVEEVVQELPLAMAIFIEAGEVSYSIGNNHNAEPIPIYSTRRVLSDGSNGLNGQGAFLNPSVDAVGLLDGVDPNLLALLSIRPLGNQSSAAVPTAVFAQTKFGSTKFRSQTSGSARRPSRLNGGSNPNGSAQQNGTGDGTPISHGGRGPTSAGTPGSGARGSNSSTPNGWAQAPQPGQQVQQQQTPQSSGIISPASRYQQNENVFSTPPLPPVVTSAAASVLGNSTAMASCGTGVSSARHGNNSNGLANGNGYRTPATDFAYLLQDLHGCGSSISSPALSEFGPSLTSSYDGNSHLRSSNGHTMNGHHSHMGTGATSAQRHSYHGNATNSNNGGNIPSMSSSSSSGFFPNSNGNSAAIGSLLFDSGIVSPSSIVASSWSSSTPLSGVSRSAEKLTAVHQNGHNVTFSDHSNSSSTSSSGSLSLFNGSLNGGHCGDSWGLSASGTSGLGSSTSGAATNVFSESNAAITGTSQWVQSLRLAAVTGGSSGWDQLTATES